MRRKYSSFIPKDIPMSIFHRKRWHWKVAYNYNILCVQYIPKAMRLYAISLVFSSQMPTEYADYKPIMTFKQSRDRNPPFTYVNWGHTSIFRYFCIKYFFFLVYWFYLNYQLKCWHKHFIIMKWLWKFCIYYSRSAFNISYPNLWLYS